MKAVGIVVEYNPFHNGHLYHVQQARKETNSDIVIAVMSASFLQRGEPAIVSKWQRTKMALAGGVDVVVELPYLYSTQKAELFAKGAVLILTEMGVDSINFGSESGRINDFVELFNAMKEKNLAFDEHVKNYLKKGFSYPRATAEAFKQLHLGPNMLALDEPNNILGYHYVKAVHEGKRKINVSTTHRRQAHYHDQDVPASSIASATSIRQMLKKENGLSKTTHVMPTSSSLLLEEYLKSNLMLHDWEHYYPFLHYKIMSSSAKQLQSIYECEEGLEFRAKEMMQTATSFQEWMKKMKTKRYTWTRLQRLATHILTNTTKEEIEEGLSTESLPYIRLLGMSDKGQAFLNQTKKHRQTSLITRVAKAEGIMAMIEERATNIYFTPLSPATRGLQMKQEFNQPPFRMQSLKKS